MKTLILGSMAAAALALSIGAASAQSQRDGDTAVTLTPEQRAIVRDVVRDELQDRLGNRIADRLSHLTPAQREALRSASSRDLQQKSARGFRTGSRTSLVQDPVVQYPVSLVKGCRARSATVLRNGLRPGRSCSRRGPTLC